MEYTHFVSVAGLVINDRDEILLLKSPKRGWEYPGGMVEPHETLQEALIREIQEETGVTVQIQGFDKDGSKKPVKSRLCGQQQAMRQLKLNKFTGQGYRFHQWYPFSVAPH